MASHTACPVPLQIEASRYRIYFGSRDGGNHPYIGWIEIDLRNPEAVLAMAETPALAPGEPGYFDDNGVYPSWLVTESDRLLLYYMGRSNGEAPRYGMAIGLAESRDGGRSFSRLSPAPIVDRSEYDPWMVSTPCVLRSGDRWMMWYLSGLRWDMASGKSYYHIKYAESDDGRSWRRNGRIAIDFLPGESNIASPAVLRGDDGWQMWYCTFINGGYRIGYARSADGLSWTRQDDVKGLLPSGAGWDGQGVAYPHVFRHENRTLMVYSGNEFGRAGIGLAEWIEG